MQELCKDNKMESISQKFHIDAKVLQFRCHLRFHHEDAY